MNKTAIEWCDLTWNPVTGCRGPHGTPCSYCYAKRIATHFAGSKAFPNGFEPTFHPERLLEPMAIVSPQRIFVGSMTDMFGEWVTGEQFNAVIEVIINAPQHTFYMLTRQPWNIGEHMAFAPIGIEEPILNLWLGVTVTCTHDAEVAKEYMRMLPKAWHRFASMEPLMDPVDYSLMWWADWLIIGQMTGPKAKEHPAPRDAVANLIMRAYTAGVPVLVKDNMHWPGEIKQWPKGAD